LSAGEVCDDTGDEEDCVLTFGSVPPLIIKPVMIAIPAITVSV
jgi:hypothetical protein